MTVQSDSILKLAECQLFLAAVDVRARGWSPQLLINLHQAGRLRRVARGLYRLPDGLVGAGQTEHQTLCEICRAVPRAVICLLSALEYHQVSQPAERHTWTALPEGSKAPKVPTQPLKIKRLRGAAYSEGIETTMKHGAALRVYSLPKTLTDGFKFRHQIGLETAVQALNASCLQGRLNMNELLHFAEINRVAKVMRPYLVSLGA